MTILETLLAAPKRDADRVPFRELPGFLFAVLNGPEAIQPEEWMQEVFGGTEPAYESPAQRQTVIDELTALGDAAVAPLAVEPAGLPAGATFTQPPLANFADDAPISAWARGFLRGYGWTSESWTDVDEDFGTVLGALAFFSSKRFAVDAFEASPNQLEELAATTLELFADAAVEYQRVGHALAGHASH